VVLTVARPIEQAPRWLRDLAPTPDEEAAADAEQAALLARVRAGEAGVAVPFEELAARLGLDLGDGEDLDEADAE
jgi:hypothetical protein